MEYLAAWRNSCSEPTDQVDPLELAAAPHDQDADATALVGVPLPREAEAAICPPTRSDTTASERNQHTPETAGKIDKRR